MAATSVRHELVSMVLLLGATCLLQRLAPCQPQARPRFLLSIGTVLLVYAAAFSKQQALIVWPLGFWMGLQPVLQSHPGAIQGWLTAWKQRRRSTGLLLAGGCGLAWVLCAIPDLDLINLPVWTAINLSFVVILMLGRNDGQRKTDWVPCLLWVIALGLLITKGIAPNWWQQAVTGFPSWMLMFGRQQQSLQEHGADLLQGLQDYAEGLFVLPQLALSSLGVIALVAVILCITEPAKTSEQPINRNQTWLGIGVAWILAIAVLLICSARVNQPYTVYFFPPFMVIATWSVHSAMPWPPSAHSRRWESSCITAGAIVLLATGSLASFENLWHLNRYSQAALPETWICTSQNMDRAMGLTAVGRCKSFQQEADKKSIFDDWHGPH